MYKVLLTGHPKVLRSTIDQFNQFPGNHIIKKARVIAVDRIEIDVEKKEKEQKKELTLEEIYLKNSNSKLSALIRKI